MVLDKRIHAIEGHHPEFYHLANLTTNPSETFWKAVYVFQEGELLSESVCCASAMMLDEKSGLGKPSMTDRFWLAEDIVIELHTDGFPTIVLPGARHRLQLGLGSFLLLCEVACFNSEGRPITLEDLGNSPNLLQLITQLVDLRVLVEEDKRKENNDKSSNLLSLLEWATIRMSQVGGCFAPSLPKGRKAPQRFRALNNGIRSRALPEPEVPIGAGLWDTLAARRSCRSGPKRTIAITLLSALLSYSLRIQSVAEGNFGEISFRPVASGGARHPIDVFVAALRVSELEEGIYQYNPLIHHLIPFDVSSDTAATLSKVTVTALGDMPDILPAITLFFTAVPARTACKYEDISLSLIMKDLGCITQQLYLLVQGLGLTGCAIGSANPTAIEKGLGLDTKQEVFVGGFVLW